MYDGVRDSKVRDCIGLFLQHMLHRWRLSGKNRKKLLSEEAILGGFIYIIRNKFGLSDWSFLW